MVPIVSTGVLNDVWLMVRLGLCEHVVCVFVFLLCFSRIIVDEWLEVCMSDAAAGEQIVSASQQLRSSWEKLLDSQLQGRVSALVFLTLFPSCSLQHPCILESATSPC